MYHKFVNFCYRDIRINGVRLCRRVQPFWNMRDGTVRCTLYALDATAVVETRTDAVRLARHGYRVIQIDTDELTLPDIYIRGM